MAQVFEDLSGTTTTTTAAGTFDNPFDALITGCNHDAAAIQARYQLHRTTRNNQQAQKLLDPSFPGVSIDPILLRLEDQSIEPGFQDPRHCLVFWGRPTEAVKDVIGRVQEKLKSVVPGLWLMPRDSLHITVFEVTHSRTDAEIAQLVDTIRPSMDRVVDYTFDHRARLVKPMISYDASALALSWVPAAGEGEGVVHGGGGSGSGGSGGGGRTREDDQYTYHHLRRDVSDLCKATGVELNSRYIVPSSHLTIGRFIREDDFVKEEEGGGGVLGEGGKKVPDPHKMKRFVEKIDEINKWLQDEYWPTDEGIKIGGEWIVGQEKGLVCNSGMLWYGGGDTRAMGKGF